MSVKVLSHPGHFRVEGKNKSSCPFYTLMSCHVLWAASARWRQWQCSDFAEAPWHSIIAGKTKVSKERKEHNMRAEVWHHERTLAAAKAWFRLAGLLIRIISHWQLQSPQCKFSAGWIRRIMLATFFSLVCAWIIQCIWHSLQVICWVLGG